MMRLWKGLYYCFWMSDKPLVQEELAESISSFIKCFHSQDSSLLFIQSFLQTFGREWFGIDRSERLLTTLLIQIRFDKVPSIHYSICYLTKKYHK